MTVSAPLQMRMPLSLKLPRLTFRELELVIQIQRWWRQTKAYQRRGRYHLHLAAKLGRRSGGAKSMDVAYWLEAADPKHRYGSRLKP
eukprot:CAMPEP_0197684268 /NCGR_PEP_ID=MMETSP1338-20131121/99261_1 /TAXON_ID=43686 ORGANISM="Pelagodinium beii, Strain RCC1491" /NCGR_SAMPLE_ID=MMETSP1338 /ASSEMBLY_ACC=CAM_ASM_000754 /LENGTH=86 /DNA_ID=CAMNT_0043265963 /DNA_START=51 /DNA_END=308 /DNA_ORIENTATION=+